MRDWMVYRAGLNTDEVLFLWENTDVLKGSLEVFAPMHRASPFEHSADTFWMHYYSQCKFSDFDQS